MATDTNMLIDCTGLDAFQDFGAYANEVRSRTSFNNTLLQQCRVPICGALWGYGIPDISGIGVAVGYILANALGPLLSLLLLLTPYIPLKPHHKRSLQIVLTAALAAFFDSAVYFAIAIAIATTGVLVPKDWEPASAPRALFVGEYEARSAALATAATVLPLVYPVAILAFAPRWIVRFPRIGGQRQQEGRQGQEGNFSNARMVLRKILFGAAVIASVYPFFSHSVRIWSPAQSETGEISGGGGGDGDEPIIRAEEWAALTRLCFRGSEENTGPSQIEWLTERESQAIGAIHLASSLFVLLFASGCWYGRC